jgi:hypothetical protein
MEGVTMDHGQRRLFKPAFHKAVAGGLHEG